MTANRKTLFAKLAPQFSVQTENVAVEALGHILSGSEAARSALAEVLLAGGADLGRIAQVRTQVIGKESERPDLVGFDQDGEKRLLIEAKFWAGLTEAQPVAYLESLTETPSALLFVAPEARLDSLWAEVCRKTSKSGISLDLSGDGADGLRSAAVNDGLYLLLTSWRSLLSRMAAKAAHAADSHAEADLRQLQGLCEWEDGEAFLPLRAEEFGLEFPPPRAGPSTTRGRRNQSRMPSGLHQRGGPSGDTPGMGLRTICAARRRGVVVRSQLRSLGSDSACPAVAEVWQEAPYTRAASASGPSSTL